MNYFEKFKQIFTEAANDSEGLKEGGRVLDTSIPWFVLHKEGTRIVANSTVNPASNATFNWYNGSPATITANTPNAFIYCTPTSGRMYVIKRVRILSTTDCFLHMQITRQLAYSIGGGTGPVNLDGMIAGHSGRIVEATGGSFTFEFTDPLILQSGDRMIIYYYKNSTTGLIFTHTIEGVSLTNDINYSANKTMLVLGDSIGIAANDLALQTTLWPFMIRDRYLAQGKDVRLINICQGGSSTDTWDWWVKQGRIDNMKADILFVNLGMNDAAGVSGLVTGTGFTKTGLKNIVNRYLLFNPTGKVVINNITQTDKLPNVTNVAAYRLEIAAAVQEMQALNLPVYFADVSTAYSASTGTAFVSTEQSAGSRLHPNDIGQAAMVPIIWNVCQNLI